MEIAFFLEAAALADMIPGGELGEAELHDAFDQHLERIHKARSDCLHPATARCLCSDGGRPDLVN
jgi:hypothetical protein